MQTKCKGYWEFFSDDNNGRFMIQSLYVRIIRLLRHTHFRIVQRVFNRVDFFKNLRGKLPTKADDRFGFNYQLYVGCNTRSLYNG